MGEELICPLEVLSAAHYSIELVTPKVRRPIAWPPSIDPQYQDPPLGKCVTFEAMAQKVKYINNPAAYGATNVGNHGQVLAANDSKIHVVVPANGMLVLQHV